jgi:hypothetical protein
MIGAAVFVAIVAVAGVLAMSALNEPVAKLIGKLFRRLSSDFEGEQLNVVAAMKRLFASEGLSFSDIATVIENHNGEIEELKFSESDMDAAFKCGKEKGRVEEACKQQDPPEFYDEDGRPRWNAIALFCQQQQQRLRPSEKEFVDDMAGKTMWREPTEKQAKWLLSIFIRLGGRIQQ